MILKRNLRTLSIGVASVGLLVSAVWGLSGISERPEECRSFATTANRQAAAGEWYGCEAFYEDQRVERPLAGEAGTLEPAMEFREPGKDYGPLGSRFALGMLITGIAIGLLAAVRWVRRGGI